MTKIGVRISVLNKRRGYYGYSTAKLEVDCGLEDALQHTLAVLSEARQKVRKDEKIRSERITLDCVEAGE